MNKIKRYLYVKGIFKLKETTLNKWAKNKNIDGLLLALDKGLYNIRIASILLLVELLGEQSVDMIKKCIDDPVQTVSEYAMDSIELI